MLEARAHLESLTATRAATQGKVGASIAAVSSAHAAVGTAEAALNVAEVQLAEAQVLAPFDGLVVQRNLQPGEWAAPGTPVVTMEDLSQLWVRLDIEETRLEGLHLGQQAEVHVIGVPGKSTAATPSRLAPRATSRSTATSNAAAPTSARSWCASGSTSARPSCGRA